MAKLAALLLCVSMVVVAVISSSANGARTLEESTAPPEHEPVLQALSPSTELINDDAASPLGAAAFYYVAFDEAVADAPAPAATSASVDYDHSTKGAIFEYQEIDYENKWGIVGP